MKKVFGIAVGAALVAAAAPAAAQGPALAPATLVPPPPLDLSVVLASNSIAIGPGAGVIAIAHLTNNSPDAQEVTLSYAQISGQTGACALPGWSSLPVLVKPGSTVSGTTRVPAPGCVGDYVVAVSADAASGLSAPPATVVFNQFARMRH